MRIIIFSWGGCSARLRAPWRISPKSFCWQYRRLGTKSEQTKCGLFFYVWGRPSPFIGHPASTGGPSCPLQRARRFCHRSRKKALFWKQPEAWHPAGWGGVGRRTQATILCSLPPLLESRPSSHLATRDWSESLIRAAQGHRFRKQTDLRLHFQLTGFRQVPESHWASVSPSAKRHRRSPMILGVRFLSLRGSRWPPINGFAWGMKWWYPERKLQRLWGS